MILQMRDVFQEDDFVTERDMIKQYQVLVKLAMSPTCGTTGTPNLRQSKLTARNSLTPATRTAST